VFQATTSINAEPKVRDFPHGSYCNKQRVKYSIAKFPYSGKTLLANPDDLHKSFYTKRKKDVIEFDFGDSGKTAFFAVQIENEGKKPPGTLIQALIP
jgi:hypothetical protein